MDGRSVKAGSTTRQAACNRARCQGERLCESTMASSDV